MNSIMAALVGRVMSAESKTMSASDMVMSGQYNKSNIFGVMTREVKEAENDKDSQKLQEIVGQHIRAIMAMLETQQEKLDRAKRLANRAKDIAKEDTFSNSFKRFVTFGAGGINIEEERAKATAEGLVATNEAMAEMNKVIQGIVALTCCSAAYSKIMIETMGGILIYGFDDAAGQRQQLSESQKKVVEHIVAITKQHAMKDLKVLEQDEKIEQIFEILKNKDEIDSRQDEQIRKNAELIAQNQQNILELQKRNNKIMAIFAWIAIVISVASLSISIFSLLK